MTAQANAQERVRIGFSDSPPISSRNPNTKALEGLAVSVSQQVAVLGGFEAKTELVSFSVLLSSLTDNKFDTVTMSGNPERRRLAAFTRPFARYGEALLVRSDDPKPYVSLTDLHGRRVGSNAGGGWIDAAEKAGAEITTFPGAEQSLQALESGTVQAVVGNAPTYTYLLRSGAYPHVRLVQSYVPQQVNEIAFAVRLADGALMQRLDAAVKILDAKGELARLRAQWGF
jgi:ABC-type amino acid transport substrate-binding protein